MRKDWNWYLDNQWTVVMDNDGWWFKNPDSEGGEWESGGDGPYGRDLLEHILKEIGIKMEYV